MRKVTFRIGVPYLALIIVVFLMLSYKVFLCRYSELSKNYNRFDRNELRSIYLEGYKAGQVKGADFRADSARFEGYLWKIYVKDKEGFWQ